MSFLSEKNITLGHYNDPGVLCFKWWKLSRFSKELTSSGNSFCRPAIVPILSLIAL
jgi:hypothetical protein